MSFEKVRVFVFWTKNPAPMFGRLEELDRRGINYYFHFTLNDYVAEGLEPGIPGLDERIASFQQLAHRIGKERVIWRFDPLIKTDGLSPEVLVQRLEAVARQLSGHTERLVASIFKPGANKKADRKLARAGIKTEAFTEDEVAFVAEHLIRIGRRYEMAVRACAGQDLGRYGIQPNKCVDDDLLRSVFAHDKDLMDYLAIPANVKRSGLRAGCRCIPSVDIGKYSTCRHGCLYCYANASDEAVARNLKRI